MDMIQHQLDPELAKEAEIAKATQLEDLPPDVQEEVKKKIFQENLFKLAAYDLQFNEGKGTSAKIDMFIGNVMVTYRMVLEKIAVDNDYKGEENNGS